MNSEPDSNVLVSITILDKEYKIACKPDQQNGLRASAQYLDQHMREIRQSAKLIGADRIAMIAALNITHELLDERHNKTLQERILNDRIKILQTKIDQAMNNKDTTEAT